MKMCIHEFVIICISYITCINVMFCARKYRLCTLNSVVILLLILIDICRYFEGQIAPISEADDKVDVEHAPIRVTEAAEKVSVFFIFFIFIYLCVGFGFS